jgi:hypothetical protein
LTTTELGGGEAVPHEGTSQITIGTPVLIPEVMVSIWMCGSVFTGALPPSPTSRASGGAAGLKDRR